MSTSISVVCYKSKILANGEHPLMLRVCKDNNRQYQSLGLSIREEHWNFKKGKPKNSCPNKEHIEKIISKKLLELNQTVIELSSEQRTFSSSTLLEQQKGKINEVTLGRFTKRIIEKLFDDGKIGNQLVYRRVYTSIFKFTKGKIDIPFYEITNDWLLKYEKWLRKNNNQDTSISILFRTLRSIYNKAIKEKCARKEDYPFEEFCISKFNTKTKKRAVAKEKVLKLNEKIKPIGNREYVELSKDLFLFSYYCGGINFIDMANLTKSNIIKNELTYIRQKTGKQINIRIPDPAQKILSKYKNNDCGYVFPIFDKNIHITPIQKHNRAHKILTKVNRNLKDIAAQLNIEEKLTTYVARHSFATTLKKSGVDIVMISELLGHSDLSTTQIYLDSFDNDQIDNAMKNLF